jgi:hypothetical protein
MAAGLTDRPYSLGEVLRMLAHPRPLNSACRTPARAIMRAWARPPLPAARRADREVCRMITVMCGYTTPAIWTQTGAATSSPRHAVDGVSMEVPAGEVGGGGVPHGADTTTTIRPGRLSSRTAYPTED